ncbi:MAG: beta-ketoacyl synthase N-terminal-like domain-containing protein [Flavobacteriaceae bacterium]|nr:beta-ketoacyl synthase chain length factor [Flavobacteriaceae bacterium]
MKKVFINGLCSVSAQKTFDNNFFLGSIIEYKDTVIPAVDPLYKEFILPAAARRMAKGIKMGVVASKIALANAKINTVDAIITGTGMGCVRDSEKFVSDIIDNNEEFLTPTAFIQSTHNTVGGQIALEITCQGYNFTYVHSSISFESALMDALLQLQNEEATNILVGGVDELGDHTVKIHSLIGHIKHNPVSTFGMVNSETEGAVFSEGANFFVLSNKAENNYAQLIDVQTYNVLEAENLPKIVTAFLNSNQYSLEEIDMVVLGNNGDVKYDGYYNILTRSLFSKTPQVYYKHLCGEFNTSSAFGFWLASKILKTQNVPSYVMLNDIYPKKMDTILLYNQYRGENHSFVLLKKC